MEAKNLVIDEMSVATFKIVVEKIHRLTGITINDHKKTMIQSRLKKRMRVLDIASYEDYIKHVDKSVSETQFFINSVTTNETVFFRTPRVWEYFQKDFLPSWFEKNPKNTLKIWSAAASSGEEGYSLAMSCMDFKNLNSQFEFKITGTDISTFVLEEAGIGVYDSRSVEFLMKSRKDLFEKYFTKTEDENYAVSDVVKNKVSFSLHNLFGVKKEIYDIIFLRNVLIYFSAEDQEKVLLNISKSMHKDSILVIGESESLNRLQTPFEFKQACIYKIKGSQ